MIKSKLLKALALGLCISAVYTGAAFAAQTEGGSEPAYGGVEVELDEETKALFDKQIEIDQYVFVDHVKEIEEMGFAVVYTGVDDTQVEIGITPYEDSYAQYLTDVFGSDVRVVASEEPVLYTITEEAPDRAPNKAATSEIIDEPRTNEIKNTIIEEIDSDTPVSSTDVVEDIKAEEEKFTIQIESFEGDDAVTDSDSELMYQTDVAVENQENKEYKTVSATDDSAIAETTAVKDDVSKGLSTPIIILIIAGGAALLGGAVLLTNKKKTFK